MNKDKSWSIIGQPHRIREDRGGRIITLLAATSCFGVEAFMIIEGSVNSAIWCYFIAQIQKSVFPRLKSKVRGLDERDIVLLYDNCSSHTGKIAGWWMRNLRCVKMTTVPYTPEFNPVERLFNTLKWKSSDGVMRN